MKVRSWSIADQREVKMLRVGADDPVTALLSVPGERGDRVVAGTLSGGLRFWYPAADRPGPVLEPNGRPVRYSRGAK